MDRSTVERHRLALFGRLVMGVAHEVDNHLSVVLGFAELIRMPGGDAAKAPENAGKIFAAGDRIASIIKRFSHHVRPHPPTEEIWHLRDLVSDLVGFARYDLCRGNVSLRIAEDLPPAKLRADSRDIGLALLSLLLNGAEAMSERGGGDLSLSAHFGDGGLEITVTDDGPGIPGDLHSRIFEEGFTTKRTDLHFGMGLPVSRHLVEAAGGTLRVENRPEGGCAAAIRLPAF
ncbi:MAG: hypothetical protein Kow00128_08300 [Deltaproteobacteria bacterium]